MSTIEIIATHPSTTITSDDQRLIQALWDAVESAPEFVYPAFDYDDSHSSENLRFYAPGSTTCLYSNNEGEPLCVVGHGLFRLDPALLPAYGVYSNADQIMENLIASKQLNLGQSRGRFGVIESWVAFFANDLQLRQDKQMPWKDSWDYAVESLWQQHRVRIEVKP